MADISRSVYLSRKFSSVNEDSSKNVYDGIFSASAATKGNGSSFAARINEYRDIFPPSSSSLGSNIPILDLPAGDRRVDVGSELDYADVFGGLGDNDGIEVATDKFFSVLKKSVKRDAHLPRIPVPTRRIPSKSQEFSFSNGNDQMSRPEKTKRIPSRSQEFSCNYGNDQTLGPAQAARVPSKSQEFVGFHGHDQTSSSAQARRIASPSQEVSSNCVNGQTSSPRKKNKISSESQESSGSPVNDQKSSPAQTRRVPSKSQEFPFNYGNDQTSSPGQPRRMPSKSQEFPCQNGNDQILKPPQLRKQYSQSQEFPSNFSTNQMPTSPVQTRRPFLSSEGDTLSVTCPNVLQSASALPHETVDSVKHVSFSYNKTNQLGIDSPNGMTHIAHLHAVPGYTHFFDETGPVRKPSFDKAKRLSMGDADFSTATAEVSRQGKHLRTVSDLGTARDTDKPQTCSMSMSNSPQSFGSSGYYKRSSRRRNNSSTNNQENISYANPFMLLEEELDVNSTAAISAAALKRAVEEAEVKIRWAKEFLKDLESNGFIKPTLKDSFKVRGDIGHLYNTYAIKQNRSMKIKLTRQKKFFNEEKVLKQNSYLNSDVSVGDCHAYEAGEVKPTFGLKQALHVLSAGVDTNVRNPTLENFEERNSYDELKFAEKSCKDESGGEWEAAKHLSQLFTGVRNRFVSFMSKQADTEKTVMQKDAPNNCEYMEQSRERPPEVCNLNNDRKMEADLDHTAEVKRSACYPSVNIDLELRTSDSAASPDTEILASKQCRLSEPEEQVECAEALVSENRRNDVKQGSATEVKGELLQEVREQNQEMLDEKVKIQSEIDMGTTGPEECNELLENDKVKNREYNEETVDVVPVLEPDETRVDESLKKEAVTSRQIEGCNLTEIEMLKDVKRKQGVRVEEEASMVEERCETSGGEEETCGEKDDTERITGPDVTSETDECLTEVVNDFSYEHDEDRSATDELFLSRNQEFSVPDTINQYVQGVKSTQRASDVVDDESEHDEYLPAVDDILEQYEFLSSSRNEERDTQSQYAIDVDLPSQEGAALTEATSAIFEHEGNSDRLRSVEMADQLNEECNSDISVSDIEGADDVCEKDENSCVNRNTETAIPDRNQYAQEERAYVENEKMTTGGQMENDLAGDISDLEDKETKEADDPSPSIDIEITEHDSVLKFEHNLSDEDDELEVSTREANGQDVSSHNSELSHRRRRWSDEVAKFHQPGILQENERTMEMDQENAETLAVKDGVEDCGDEIVNNSGEQEADGDDSDQDLDQKSEGLKSSGGSHRRRRRRRRWFDNSSENVQLEPSFVKPVGVTVVMDHEVAKHDVSSQSVDEKLARKREDVTDEMENANSNIPSDKAKCGASTEAGHRRRRWFENGQKSEDPDTPKQELDETSSSEESANAQKSEEQMKAREKQAVERAIREARQRAFAEAKERANAVKAAAAAAASLQDKASMDAKLRAERAAVERATAEARERALQKSMSEKVIYKSREKVEFKNLNSGSSSSGISTSANVAPFTTGRPSGATESPQRRKAISERNKRTTERAAKALEEKNMRDVLAQKEHAERNRFAGVLDAEVKRWSTGKEGNLRYLLSTLQYILGPDSGWQPIPLTDLVTTTAVRKAYKRAALCVHPDKLQQRRATVQQKYICEKVFDLLKDAWLKFNPDEM